MKNQINDTSLNKKNLLSVNQIFNIFLKLKVKNVLKKKKYSELNFFCSEWGTIVPESKTRLKGLVTLPVPHILLGSLSGSGLGHQVSY